MMGWKKLTGMLAAFALLALVMAYFAGLFNPTVEPGRVELDREAGGTPENETVAVRRREVPVLETATGTVRAGYETVVSARITAAVESTPVTAADRVEKGEVLFRLDDRDVVARLEQARQTRAAASARLDEARSSFERIEQLHARGTVSVAELDAARAQLRVAEAELERAERSVDEAETALSWTVIRAPIDGRVVDHFVDPGDMVTPATPMARLYDPERLRLEANVRESLARAVHTGDTVRVRIDALDRTVAGTVEEVVPSADPGSRTFVVKVGLAEAPDLFPGMFGRLTIELGRTERLLIPAEAVRRVGQLEFVRVLDPEGRPQRRFIRTGAPEDDRWIAVHAGLSAGERVVVPAPGAESASASGEARAGSARR